MPVWSISEVYIYASGLSPDNIKGMGAFAVDDPQQIVERLLQRHSRVVAIPEGPYVVGCLSSIT